MPFVDPLEKTDKGTGFVDPLELKTENTQSPNLLNAPGTTLIRSGSKAAGEAISGIVHPLQAVANVARVGLGGLEKAGIPMPEQQMNVDTGEITPSESNKPYFEAAYEGVKEKATHPVKYALEDPVGFAIDVASVLSGTSSILNAGRLTNAATTISKIKGYIDPFSLVDKGIGKTRQVIAEKKLPGFLGGEKLPQSLYARAMKIPPGSLRQEDRAKIIDYLLVKERLPLGKDTRDKLNAIVTEVEGKIQPALDKLSKSGSEFSMDNVYQQLDGLKSKFARRRDAKECFAIIDEIKRDYMEHEFVTKTMASKLEPSPYAPYGMRGGPWAGTEPKVISREIFLNKAQELKKGIYERQEPYYKKGAMPETGRVGLRNDIEAFGEAELASMLRGEILNHPDTPIWVKGELAREAGAMKARKWVERAANRGGNIDPISLGSMAFGMMVEHGVPAALAYKIGMSQSFQSRAAIFLVHGSKTMQKIPTGAGLALTQAGRAVNIKPSSQAIPSKQDQEAMPSGLQE